MDIAHCNLNGNADAVDFCPHDSFHHVLAASTYNLEEGIQPNRSGSISLFSVDADAGRLELFYHLDTAGIFDVKWNPIGANFGPLLAQADADGYLRLYTLECCLDRSTATGLSLREISGEKVSSSMCLCVDWNLSATSISVGLSDGSISVFSQREAQLETQKVWEAHEFEVWTTSFDVHQPQLLYSGSDDCRFSCWDLRESPSKLAFQNRKAHKMGVCCIAKSPNDPNSLLTGSYDENLRLWDVRSISKPISENSICLGGGVWRIKHHPSLPGLILAACMHNGFAILRIRGDKAELLETYSNHNSLAYGGDWQKGPCTKGGQERNPLVATCSFYDRLLRIWMPKTEVLA